MFNDVIEQAAAQERCLNRGTDSDLIKEVKKTVTVCCHLLLLDCFLIIPIFLTQRWGSIRSPTQLSQLDILSTSDSCIPLFCWEKLKFSSPKSLGCNFDFENIMTRCNSLSPFVCFFLTVWSSKWSFAHCFFKYFQKSKLSVYILHRRSLPILDHIKYGDPPEPWLMCLCLWSHKNAFFTLFKHVSVPLRLFFFFCSVSSHLLEVRFYCIYFNFKNEMWMHAAGREKTNRSAATTDLITETTIPACDNLMTVLHPPSKTFLLTTEDFFDPAWHRTVQ